MENFSKKKRPENSVTNHKIGHTYASYFSLDSDSLNLIDGDFNIVKVIVESLSYSNASNTTFSVRPNNLRIEFESNPVENRAE